MSQHLAFRRQPVPQQYAQQLQTVTLAAPTRGISQSENDAFMTPGGAVVQDNWLPTLRGVKLRGGTALHCDLHGGHGWDVATWDTSRWDTAPTVDPATRKPVVSMFEYINGASVHQMFAGQPTMLYDVSLPAAVLVKSGQSDGNYSATQLANASGEHLIAVNDSGDPPLHYDGTTWEVFNASQITGPAGSGVETGLGLTQVWTYQGRMFFIQGGTLNAYFLNVGEYKGVLQQIPLGGSAAKGGALLFGATWSLDTGSGTDDKCVFVTTEGELLVFSGINPADATVAGNWAQQGRYAIGRPLGKNAHMLIGGDLLIATVDGIVPVSQAINKDAGTLDLALPTRPIRSMWRSEVAAKSDRPWTMKRWDIFGGVFVTWPGGLPGNRYCALMNNATMAWCRLVGYDALCFAAMGDDFFYGTQDGTIVQCERGGTDQGAPYVATLVGGWELFQAPSAEIVWRQARAVFAAAARQPFQPQLNATVDYVVVIPPPPLAGPDPGVADVWDQGLWDAARFDQATPARPPLRNTMWVSIGKTGFAHAPVVQITVSQAAPPDVELLAISATYERAGVNV
jgi:hypothetical protein